MAKEVEWSRIVLDEFISEAMLTQDEELVMRTRMAGWSRQQQADELGVHIRTIDRIISRLKAKYDAAQKYSLVLPPRKKRGQDIIFGE